jgi:hypothetical protein
MDRTIINQRNQTVGQDITVQFHATDAPIDL